MQKAVPSMTPAPGDRVQRFVGDTLCFHLKASGGMGPKSGWRAMLRTNLGRADLWRREILQAHTYGLAPAGVAWHDVPMAAGQGEWSLEFPLTETGYFRAKAYLVDAKGWQHWPEGPDVGVCVHPNRYRTANTIYCAFARMFGDGRGAATTTDPALESQISPLDKAGYTVIPPSGKLRDLAAQVPHIVERLGCRILHLLPINPTPTTYGRYGRFGSPYAALDLTGIDPALVVLDKRTTGVDQFRELTYAAHLHGARVFLDMVINHTGWGSVLQESHPEWFQRKADGSFASPGAWGVVWEDLVELKHQNVALCDELAETFLTWCNRGVDGFRCDAGYMVPVESWQYIVARVQQEFPETLFLLEGLGGAWEATEALLTEGGMQWAYSELFQNYSGSQVAHYLDHSLKQSQRVGLLVHYSETHDNNRLAAQGRPWSLVRNRLSGLASVSGGFGFTCGVEWLATEKIRVHGSTGMAWDNPENIVRELAELNTLLADHPCFFDGAKLERLSPAGSGVYVLRRDSAEGKDTVLVVVNTDLERAHAVTLEAAPGLTGAGWVDLLGQTAPSIRVEASGKMAITAPPGAAYCLAAHKEPQGLRGEAYRRARAQAAAALEALGRVFPAEEMGRLDWRQLAAQVERSPFDFLAGIGRPGENPRLSDPGGGGAGQPYPRVVVWTMLDARRMTLVPPGHWLLVQDSSRFRATLTPVEGGTPRHAESFQWREGAAAWFPPRETAGEATLALERYDQGARQVQANLRFLDPVPKPREVRPSEQDLVLLTNERGGMARMCVDLGRVRSKYDCVLGANLHPTLPVDRHVFAKRIRVWVNADGFVSPLDSRNLVSFQAGPPVEWHFVANAGDGRQVEIRMRAQMLAGRNTTVFQFRRPPATKAAGKQLPPEADVRLTVRLDIEDRNFHWETKHNGGADYHFATHTKPILDKSAGHREARGAGFAFAPAADRQLKAYADTGWYHAQPEWSFNLPHPVEQSRGQTGSGDAFSPGWFEVPLGRGAEATLAVTAEVEDPSTIKFVAAAGAPAAGLDAGDTFGRQLSQAARAFVVRRGEGQTVIAGYPWFLDWGRDTFICARGLLAAGMREEVRAMLTTFARFEKDGTLPNTIHGEDATNRDTSDAPLWFGIVCEELGDPPGGIDAGRGRSLLEVLRSIAVNYIKGTPNGIRMDADSALIWSPSHFTWMDTNYPAGTPREGYPVEIQALWVRLLRHLARADAPGERQKWKDLADRALSSVEKLFWSEDLGYYVDALLARPGVQANRATADTALRSNCLFLISLGLVGGERARRSVLAAIRYLVVPGALRSLAPLPVSVPLPIHAGDGRLLNDPRAPYWGRYEGDEDTRRKPAYHNGTAWTWTFPGFCEALARAWDLEPEAVAAAKAYLGSMQGLLQTGCLGQLPEIVDGDAPHQQRGCDAQAWGATEALRVWSLLTQPPRPPAPQPDSVV